MRLRTTRRRCVRPRWPPRTADKREPGDAGKALARWAGAAAPRACRKLDAAAGRAWFTIHRHRARELEDDRTRGASIARNCQRALPHVRAWAEEYRDCLLYTSDAADERSSVDLGGRR